MSKFQTNIDDYKTGEYKGFSIGNVVRYKKDSSFYVEEYDREMVITKISKFGSNILVGLRLKDEVGQKRHSFSAFVSVENLFKVKENEIETE